MLTAVALYFLRFCMRLCYLPLRLLKPVDKIVFLSRQDDTPGLDFRMLSKELRRTSPNTEIVMLCRRIPDNLSGRFLYIFHIFNQMYHLATAKAAVLDGYCIPASILKHRKELKIYQMWHAMGLIKKFAYTAIDTPEGSPRRVAEILRMHRGYHRIFCSAPGITADIAKCYDAPEETVLPIGMPRIDFLTDEALFSEKRRQIFAQYPELDDKKPIILYVPTFRRNGKMPPSLESAVDLSRYHLVIKGHDDAVKIFTSGGEISTLSDFSGMEWLSVASFAVTDYSAILYEAVTAKLPVCLYCGDRSEYDAVRGLSLDYDALPFPHCRTPEEVIEAIDSSKFDFEAMDDFCEKSVTARHLHTTKAIAYLILAGMTGETPTFEQIINNPLFLK